jgi:hypothetical protein
MEPRREEPKDCKPRPEEKPKRFRLVKLEERIAPSKGGTQHNTCALGCTASQGDTCTGLSIE